MLQRARPLLLIALVLVMTACDVKVEQIGLRDAGWKTYRNADLGYELSYPREWELEVRDPEPDDAVETQWIRVSGVTERRDMPPAAESVLVAVNFQGPWCTGAGRIETKEIIVSAIPGIEQECYRVDPGCLPQPNCQSQPYGIARFFPGARGKQNYLVLGDPTSDPLLVRRIIESFRFLDEATSRDEALAPSERGSLSRSGF